MYIYIIYIIYIYIFGFTATPTFQPRVVVEGSPFRSHFGRLSLQIFSAKMPKEQPLEFFWVAEPLRKFHIAMENHMFTGGERTPSEK